MAQKSRLDRIGSAFSWPFFAASYLIGKAFRAIVGGWNHAKAQSLPEQTPEPDNK